MTPLAEPVLGYAVIGVVAAHRLVEVAIDRHNAGRLLRRGGRLGEDDFAPMAAFHGIWLAGMAAERAFLGARMPPATALWALLPALAVAIALRLWVVATLRGRWTVRVVVLPGEAPVATGPYRFLRHPNYAVVAAEIALVALTVGAWRTAVVGSLVHVPVLRRRVRIEERAWRAIAGVPLGRGRTLRCAGTASPLDSNS